jgi:hypothetical protein
MKHRSVYVGVLAVCLLVANFASSQSKSKPLTNSDVVAMVKAGLPDDVIINSMAAQDTNFDVSATALLSLKKQGVSTKILNAMLAAYSKHSNSEPPSSTPAAPPTASSPTPPAATVTAAHAATPANAPHTSAVNPQPDISGVYRGGFRCGLAKFDLALSVTAENGSALTGKFDFSPVFPQQSQQRYVYDLSGSYKPGTEKLQLTPVKWESAPLPGYHMLGMKGTYDSATQQIKGKISSWVCGGVDLTRDQAASGQAQTSAPASQQMVTTSAPTTQPAAHQPSHPHNGGIFGGLSRLGEKVNESVHAAEGNVQPHPQPRPLPPTISSHSTSSGPNGNEAAMAASAGSLTASIQETLLGPLYPGPLVLSKDGGHTAIEIHKGSRREILLDGSEGPTFESVWGTVLSPNGKESGYIGRGAGTLTPVVDGKELGSLTISSCRPIATIQPWQQGKATQLLVLSPDGLHFAYMTGLDPGCPAISSSRRISRPSVFLDGKETLVHATIDATQFMFAGDRLLYVAQTEDKKWHVAVNNVLGPPYEGVGPLEVSPHGAHYAFVARKPGGSAVVTDGVEGVIHPYGVDNLVVDSTGRVAYLAGTPREGGAPTLYVGNREISDNPSEFTIGQDPSALVAFDPNGKGFAYVQRVAGGGVAAVVNGKQELTYGSITGLQFSPHGSHVAYVGVKGSLQYPVVDGRELGEENGVSNFRFSEDGSRYAFEAYKNGRFSVVVDGKESGPYSDLTKGSLIFSPDSKHYAFAACTNIMKCEVVIDGRSTPVASVGQFVTRTTNIHFSPILFSPDSNHVVYAADLADGSGGTTLILDGKVIARGSVSSFSYPTFSPDSKHFAVWQWTGRKWHLIVDGKLGPSYDDLIESNPHTVHFVDAHTLQFLGVKAGSVYRVRVDLDR